MLEPTPYILPDLPPLLEPYRDQIAASVRPYVKITIEGVRETSLWESKFGGYPYLLKDTPYPRDPDGRPMALIAQINFADVPHLEHYPEQGILQFYMSQHIALKLGESMILHGLDHDQPTEQEYWRMLYHPVVETNTSALTTDFSFLPTDDVLYKNTSCTLVLRLPGNTRGGSAGLRFEKAWQPATLWSQKPEPYLLKPTPEDLNENDYDWDLVNEIDMAYRQLFEDEIEHQIGGYASFTQDDPRRSPDEFPLLLLQMSGAGHHFGEFVWGHDTGVGNLFISQDDLIARDFSRVLYNWDCT